MGLGFGIQGLDLGYLWICFCLPDLFSSVQASESALQRGPAPEENQPKGSDFRDLGFRVSGSG